MKLIYKPFGLVISLLAGILASKLFQVVWGIFDKEEPPKPKTRDTSWGKVVASAAVQGATFKVTKAVVDRAGAKGFEHLTGAWPGPKETDPSGAAKAVRS